MQTGSKELDSKVGRALVTKIVAQKEAKAAHDEQQRLMLERSSEAAVLNEYFNQYTASMTTFQMSWQSWMDGINATCAASGTVKLILVDPPYEVGFLASKDKPLLGQLFDTMVKPGGTAVIFLSWKQIALWQEIFHAHCKSKDWVIERPFAIHRHEKYAYRSALNGHKNMTDLALVVHRKDKYSADKTLKGGKVTPEVAQVEEVLGQSPTGSWLYDFLTDQLPPDRNWYVQ